LSLSIGQIIVRGRLQINLSLERDCWAGGEGIGKRKGKSREVKLFEEPKLQLLQKRAIGQRECEGTEFGG
jgi:hypothetical protein